MNYIDILIMFAIGTLIGFIIREPLKRLISGEYKKETGKKKKKKK